MMTGPVSDVPDEAVEAALVAIWHGRPSAWTREGVRIGLAAAAPFLVAAERQRLHDRIEAVPKRPVPTLGFGITQHAIDYGYASGWNEAIDALRALVSEASASSPVSDDTGP